MTKKNLWLFGGLAALLAVYIVFFTDWFKPKTIGIFDTSRPTIRRFRNKQDLPFILFGLEGKYQLTEIKIVDLAKFEADPLTPTLWHLISDSNSLPVQRFIYGQRIQGMRPSFKGDLPQPLETNVTYRLFVTAGAAKGIHDFSIK
jgi:hypothetical protein